MTTESALPGEVAAAVDDSATATTTLQTALNH
jgi:hypothetical protein